MIDLPPDPDRTERSPEGPEGPDERLPPTEWALEYAPWASASPADVGAGQVERPAESEPESSAPDAGRSDETIGYASNGEFDEVIAGSRARKQALNRSIGDYSLIRKIASGGMGVVYLARQESLRRTVALKTILAGDLSSPDEILRFHQEAEAAAQLDHSGIVPIFEVGEHEGQHYFSMGYVEGGSLADRIKHGPLPPRQASELVRQVAEAVAYAHERGVIHRDLKPGNILLDREGHPKVSDFGLAKQVHGLSHLTVTGQVMGTPSYMAPEQASGSTGDVGPPADIYSLGALLYCLITARPPFQAATPVETLRQVLEREPAAPRQLNGAVSRDLETICLKCLQKEPSKRYDSALALADDLRRLLAGEPIRARPIGGLGRALRWCRRNKLVAALSCGVLAALLVGIVTTSYFAIQWRRAATVAEASAATARENELHARQAREQSDRRWYAAEMSLALQDWEKGSLAPLLRRLEALRAPRADAPDLRGFEWYYLQRLCHLDLRTLRGQGEPVHSVAFSPDGRLVAAGGGDFAKPGMITIWDAATGRVARSWAGHAERINSVAFSPDGKRLASVGGREKQPGEVKIWDAATAEELLVLRGQTAPVWSVAFSHDGRRLAAASAGTDAVGRWLAGEVLLWDLASDTEALHLRGHEGPIRSVTFSPDARQLVSACGDAMVKIWNASGREILTLPELTGDVTSVAFSPDGRQLAVGSTDGSARVWDASLWKNERITPQKPILALTRSSAVRSIAYSPDGRRLAAGYDDREIRTWNTTTGQELLPLRGHLGDVESVAFSPDGWRLASASADGTVKIWDATVDQRTLPFYDHRTGARGTQSIAFSPDGRWLASASSDLAVRIWDAQSASVAQTLRGHTDDIASVAFSADGRLLASGGADRIVKIWDVSTGKPLRDFRGFKSAVSMLAFAPDGRRLACGSGGTTIAGSVQIWDLATDDGVTALDESTGAADQRGFASIAFSPNGRWLAAGCGDGTIPIWDTTEKRLARTLRGHTAALRDVTFHPDGRWLASASDDQTVKLWDVTTGLEIVTLPGHTSVVDSVAFSGDGRRLASGASDYTVKLWDVSTAQEVFSLHVPWTGVRVAFAPDGRRLAVSGASKEAADHTLAMWDGRELEPELAEQAEARSRVAFLFAGPLSTPQVRERLATDTSLSESLRARALALVDEFGNRLARQEAEDRISQLVFTGLFRAEVLEHLKTDSTLSEPVRREALALARAAADNPRFLDLASRAVARRSGLGASAYQRALAQAERACELAPYLGAYQTTLGMAQYRVGKYREAVETLIGADRRNATAARGSLAPDLAFLAMAQHGLGDKERAQATLARLRTCLELPNRANDEDAKALLGEAERVILGEPAQLHR
jgi:eukaryotic-like serine/threonine-protein kinase